VVATGARPTVWSVRAGAPPIVTISPRVGRVQRAVRFIIFTPTTAGHFSAWTYWRTSEGALMTLPLEIDGPVAHRLSAAYDSFCHYRSVRQLGGNS
jgi:hypothetical protein